LDPCACEQQAVVNSRENSRENSRGALDRPAARVAASAEVYVVTVVDRVAVAELVSRIRARQGLPPRIEDWEILRRVAALVRR
jgi:hypothetical protein